MKRKKLRIKKEMENDFGKLLSKDTSRVLAMVLDSESLINLCKANKTFYEWICKDEIFWEEKMRKDYPFLLEFKEGGSWKDFYLDMVRYIYFVNKRYGIPYIPTQGYNPKDFLKMDYKNKEAFEFAMDYAARGGDINIVKLMIDKGSKNFNWAMINAAERGHMDIVKLMIENGAKSFDSSIQYAAKEGHIDIVKYLKSLL